MQEPLHLTMTVKTRNVWILFCEKKQRLFKHPRNQTCTKYFYFEKEKCFYVKKITNIYSVSVISQKGRQTIVTKNSKLQTIYHRLKKLGDKIMISFSIKRILSNTGNLKSCQIKNLCSMYLYTLTS